MQCIRLLVEMNLWHLKLNDLFVPFIQLNLHFDLNFTFQFVHLNLTFVRHNQELQLH